MCVGDEDLPEAFAAHKEKELTDSGEVEFVENIVEKKYRFGTDMCVDILKLGQLEGEKECFLLALGAETFHCELAEGEEEIVFVWPYGGILHVGVATVRLEEETGHGGLEELRVVFYGGLLVAARVGMDKTVVSLKEGSELIEESAAGLHYRLSVTQELLIPEGDGVEVEIAVFIELPQQAVALQQGFLVSHQRLKIEVVGLGDYAVDKLSPHLAAAHYQLLVAWCHNDKWQLAYMLGK